MRELSNKIQRAALVADGPVIEPSHLGLDGIEPVVPSERGGSERPSSLSAEELSERSTVEIALAESNYVVSKAAASLGISRQALYRRMSRLGLNLEKQVK